MNQLSAVISAMQGFLVAAASNGRMAHLLHAAVRNIARGRLIKRLEAFRNMPLPAPVQDTLIER